MSVKQEFHIPITVAGKTSVDWLVEESGLSRQKLKSHMQKGCVWLERVHKSAPVKDDELSDEFITNEIIPDENISDEILPGETIPDEILPDEKKNNTKQQAYIQRIRRAKKVVKEGEVLHFYYDESVLLTEPTPAVLVEDLGEYSIWNKPSGMLSQGSKWADHCTVYRWAEKHLQPERTAFIVHRLDRAANGLIILAHKKSVASEFSKLFEQRQIDKRYQVEVEGDFSKMVSKDNQKLTIDDPLDDKSAISHVRMIAFNKDNNTSTLEVQIETGRKHQIRKHLSAKGFPVVGDRLYGNGSNTLDLQLQARSLAFICPVSKEEKLFKLGS